MRQPAFRPVFKALSAARAWINPDFLGEVASVATLACGGALLWQVVNPLDAYAATKGAEVCLSTSAYYAQGIAWGGAGMFLGLMVMAFLFIAQDNSSAPPQTPTDYGAGFYDGMRDAASDRAAGRYSRISPINKAPSRR